MVCDGDWANIRLVSRHILIGCSTFTGTIGFLFEDTYKIEGGMANRHERERDLTYAAWFMGFLSLRSLVFYFT